MISLKKCIYRLSKSRVNTWLILFFVILLIISIILGIIWYGMAGPYNYNKGNKQLMNLIPETKELFFNNEKKFNEYVLKDIGSTVTNIYISYNDLELHSYYYLFGYIFTLKIIDLSVLVIAYKPNFDYYTNFIAYTEMISEDWYILIIKSPRG